MQQESHKATPAPGALRPTPPARFIDSTGRSWSVSERARPQFNGQSVKMLVFESSTAIRCVRVYPEDWQQLEPEALEFLSWRT